MEGTSKDILANASTDDDDDVDLSIDIDGKNINGSYLPKTVTYSHETGTLDGSTLFDGETNDKNNGFFKNPNNFENLTSAHLAQLQYNQNKILLDRSINSTKNIVNDLIKENTERPIFYPNLNLISINSKLNSNNSKLALIRQNSMKKEDGKDDKTRNDDKVDNNDNESNFDFEILKIDLKINNNSSNSLIKSLDKSSISTLLNEKFHQIFNHLNSLKNRIDDTKSKVLVTGDLNSGKSTFCNALLRRKVLPEDQQPCTNVFCEIVNYNENNSIEEVHAIKIGSIYNRNDKRTYEVFGLENLENLIYLSEKYNLLMVYIKDNRPTESSLLKNGIIDIRLIDAPGLNLDSYHTTQVFSRQEEIDLVVFVVNAENHFTLSGREFISNSTSDKKFIFIVVNKFDNIKNKEKCKERILQQVSDLSPETHKDSNEFIHFVSSKNILDNSGDGGDGDDNDPNPDGHAHEYSDPDFDRLEASLRNFVLEKRSISKLLPAKNYLLKFFNDLLELSSLNQKKFDLNKDKINNELKLLTPKYNESVNNSIKINEKIMKLIDDASNKVYENSRLNIKNIIGKIENANESEEFLGVRFTGYSDIQNFINSTNEAIFFSISKSIQDSENFARIETSNAIDQIREIGKKHLNDEDNESKQKNKILLETKFKPEKMYSNKKDKFLKNSSDINSFRLLDFVDFNSFNMNNLLNFFGISPSINLIPSSSSGILINIFKSGLWKTGLSGLIFVYGPQFLSVITGISSISKIPSFVYTKILPAGLVSIAIGLPIYYIYVEAPKAYTRNVIRKIKNKLDEKDFIHSNSLRISKEVRKVLNYPANDVSIGLNSIIEQHSNSRYKLINEIKVSEFSVKFYKDLTERVKTQKDVVNSFNLDF